MCTKMRILWTILMLGSFLQGAYADVIETKASTTSAGTTTVTSTITKNPDSENKSTSDANTIAPTTGNSIKSTSTRVQIEPQSTDQYILQTSATKTPSDVGLPNGKGSDQTTISGKFVTTTSEITISPVITTVANTVITTPDTTPITTPVSTPDTRSTSVTSILVRTTQVTRTPETTPLTTKITTPETTPLTTKITTPETTPLTTKITTPDTTPLTTKITTPDTTPITTSKITTTHPETSSIPVSKSPVTTNAPKQEPLNKTVAANSTGDYFEKTCANLTEAINVTGNCNMVGKKINGVIKYNRITLIMVDPLVETIPSVEINPSVITKVETTVKTTMETTVDTNNLLNMETLIAILASCGALALFLIACAVYCSYHRSSYRKNQQHLTEELQTVENGYHDNPTLEVMEVQPEMQEKKMALNGEFNDSWIVPFDNLTKDDIPEEEDTHL